MLSINFVVLVLLLATTAFSQLKPASVIGNNMVVQQGMPVKIWGWGGPGKPVTVSFLNHQYSAIANKSGEWAVKLMPAKAGASGNMLISSGSETIVVKNILVGEVWLCSGQSNMEYTMNGFKDVYETEMKTAADDNIRFIVVEKTFSNKESGDAAISRGWSAINPRSVGDCSAVAYFYAKKLREKLKVPVGLIISAWGGTPAQSWMDTAALKQFDGYTKLYGQSIKPLDFSALKKLQEERAATYSKKRDEAALLFKEYINAAYNDAGWADFELPGNWEGKGYPSLDGIAAYRIAFTIPPGTENKTAVLHLPAIDDIDSTYINGVFIGSHTVWNELRTYSIPPNTLRPGKNVIAIWVEDGQGGGGLNNDTANFFVEVQDEKIPLKGIARFTIITPAETIAAGINYASMQNYPAVLFNAMIAPLLPAAMRGVIWYQGESNVPQYEEYRTLFPALIKGWRSRMSRKMLPFLFAQLSSYNPGDTEPALSDWAFLREAQTYALRLPNTGMAVTTDIGDRDDIHPKRKKEVGERLAASAFAVVYGFKQETAQGPSVKLSSVEGNTIRLSFNNTGQGLMQKGEELNGFSIAGADKKFLPAKAVIFNGDVVVSNAAIASPVYVRYAWANAPLDANLYNKKGFPAQPFRTDK
jgi:sialate O-acetylesterase